MSEYDNSNNQNIPHHDPGQQDTDQLTYDDLLEKNQSLKSQISAYEEQIQSKSQEAEKYKSAALGKTKDKNDYYEKYNNKRALADDLHSRLNEKDNMIESLQGRIAKYEKGTESNPMVHNMKSEMEKIRQENARLAADHERATAEINMRDEREKIKKHAEILHTHIADKLNPNLEYLAKKELADHIRVRDEGGFYIVDHDGQPIYDEFGDMTSFLSTFKFAEEKFLNMPQYRAFAKEGDSSRINEPNKYNNNAYGKNPVNQMQPQQQPPTPQQAQPQGNINNDFVYHGGFSHGEALEKASHYGYTPDRVVFMDSRMWQKEEMNTKSKTTEDILFGNKQLVLTDRPLNNQKL